MPTFRSQKGNDAYNQWKVQHKDDSSCALCTEVALTEFTHWKITTNNFPYDLIAETHHMLIPKRHAVEGDLTEDERAEMIHIKNISLGQYNWVIEGTTSSKTIPSHFHLHLIIGKQL